MIKVRKILTITAVLWSAAGHAQQAEQDSIAQSRTLMKQNNYYILGAWAGANIIQGTISASNTKGSEHYLHQMNAYWNTVNLAVAGIGLLGIRKQLNRHYTLIDNVNAQQRTEKLLLLNGGLDIAYITTGLYMKERGNRLGNEKTEGYGGSLLLQGGFLLVFDVIQYFNHRRNGRLLENQLNGLQLGAAGNGLGLTYRFR